MKTILVVDDSPTEVKLVSKILEKSGYVVRWASNARRGLELAKEIKPDAILMDVVMPGMSGFQATRKIAKDESLSGIPVIMLTTKDQETDKIWGIRQGAKDYIIKPADEKELLEKISAVLMP